jgi:hypothetical protein
MLTEYELLKAAQKGIEQQFLPHEGVNAVGIGHKIKNGVDTGELAVIVFVTKKQSQLRLRLSRRKVVPKKFVAADISVQTDVQEAGPFQIISSMRPMEKHKEDRWTRWRPAPGGVSVGGENVTAGTLGIVVRDNVSGKKAILSNNHVLANTDKNPPGSKIYQPGLYDHGSEQDVIGTLSRTIPIQMCKQDGYQCPMNKYDAALALPFNENDLSTEILDVGYITGVYDANADPYHAVGKSVRKSSRTTFYSEGKIKAVNSSVKVLYEPGIPQTRKIAQFVYQIIADIDTKGGDSGSILTLFDVPWQTEDKAVGLLFAGTGTYPMTTAICNPFPSLLKDLNISLIGKEEAPPPDEIVKVELAVRGPSAAAYNMTKVGNDWVSDIPMKEGSYELQATAYTVSGRSGTSTIHVTIKAAGGAQEVKVEFIQPRDGAELTEGTIQVKVQASIA